MKEANGTVSVDSFDYARIERILGLHGVQIKNPELLKRAFTHDSYLGDGHPKSDSNEELEFLGDAVLSMIVSDWLFNHGVRTEGRLTKIRSSIVENQRLAKIADDLELGEIVLLSNGEIKTGGKKKPSILSGCFEALIGALYIDEGFGLEAARKFVKDVVLTDANQLISEKLENDSKSRLNECLLGTLKSPPVYEVLNEEGPEHMKTYEVAVYSTDKKLLGNGKGKSKQEAEENAAGDALRLLEKQKELS
jgi:ribonuclease-3